MLPTPSTSHVPLDTIYEPSEDSYLFLDTLSSPSESSWLASHFASSPPPLIVEIGTGSGVVLGFVAGNSAQILGRRDVLALGTDVNWNACVAAQKTVEKTIKERQDGQLDGGKEGGEEEEGGKGRGKSIFLSSLSSDLTSSLRSQSVDILLFNPPYVPTEEMPNLPSDGAVPEDKFESDSYFLSLTYAGGADGMQTTNRLLGSIPRVLATRGVAYVLFCRQNRSADVIERIRGWGGGWNAQVVGDSGGKAGWEKLVIVRIWREG